MGKPFLTVECELTDAEGIRKFGSHHSNNCFT